MPLPAKLKIIDHDRSNPAGASIVARARSAETKGGVVDIQRRSLELWLVCKPVEFGLVKFAFTNLV